MKIALNCDAFRAFGLGHDLNARRALWVRGLHGNDRGASCVGSLLRSLSSPFCCWVSSPMGGCPPLPRRRPQQRSPGPRGLERGCDTLDPEGRRRPLRRGRGHGRRARRIEARGRDEIAAALRGVMAGIAESRNEPVGGFRAGDMAVMEYGDRGRCGQWPGFTFRGALIAELEGISFGIVGSTTTWPPSSGNSACWTWARPPRTRHPPHRACIEDQ